jgi:F0F1-type ATP synthase assembly protein I
LLNLDRLLQNVTRFVEIKLEIYELRLKEQLSETLSNLVVLLFVMLVGFVGLVFLSLALGLFLNDLFQSNFIGLLIVGLIYLIAGFIVYRFKDRLITTRILQAIFKEPLNNIENDQTESHEDEY